MKKDDLTFWNIIDEEFGTYDLMDESNNSLNSMFTVIQPVPGVIIMINEDIHGQETW